MRAYDMENVTMRRRGLYLSLEVPGLAEKRPSLVHGDYIFVRHAYDDVTAQAYQVMFFDLLIFAIISFSLITANMFHHLSSGGIKKLKRFFSHRALYTEWRRMKCI